MIYGRAAIMFHRGAILMGLVGGLAPFLHGMEKVTTGQPAASARGVHLAFIGTPVYRHQANRRT
jgi:hypothetical protein